MRAGLPHSLAVAESATTGVDPGRTAGPGQRPRGESERSAPARQQLSRLQRRIVDSLRAELAGIVGSADTGLSAYSQAFEREFVAPFEPIGKPALLRALAHADLIYFGDYHTLAETQQTIARLLAELSGQERPLILALELVEARHQEAIERYLAGEIGEARFLAAIEYSRTWGFAWPPYRALFDFARAHGVKVVALNIDAPAGVEGLLARDAFAAELLTALTTLEPRARIAVVYGEQHLAASHLPGRVTTRLAQRGLRRRHAVVFQNHEEVYWAATARRESSAVDVVRLGSGRYCVLSASPVARWQSAVWWHRAAEAASEVAEAEPCLAGLGRSGALAHPELAEGVAEQLHTIAGFLDLVPASVAGLNVYAGDDRAFLDSAALTEHYSPRALATVRPWLDHGQSLYFARANTVYLGSLAARQVADQAARVLRSGVAGDALPLWPHSRDDFYRQVLLEALAFTSSKLLDPRRRCWRPADYQGFLAEHRGAVLEGAQAERRDVARLMLQHHALEARARQTGRRFALRRVTTVSPLRRQQFAAALGRGLGDALYEALIAALLPVAALAELFTEDFRPAGAAFARYLALAQATAPVAAALPARAAGV